MEKISSFQIRELSLSGFKCFDTAQNFPFGRLTMITGANHTGKSTIADAIAFTITGTTFFGESKIDRLYSERNPDIEVRMVLETPDGVTHELVRTRKKDRMNISYDGYSLRQQDLSELFGDRDVFLSILNPLYFVEELGEDGKALLEKYLPFIPQETVMAGISEFNRNQLAGKEILAPDTYMQNLRGEIREQKENIIALEGQSALLMTQRKDSAQALNLLKISLTSLAQEISALETKKSEGTSRNLQTDLDATVARENELLGDKPTPPDTAPMESELRTCELDLERTKAKVYESKFTVPIAETKAALDAAYAEHRKISTIAAHIKPGGKCPVCFTAITNETVAGVKNELAPQLTDIVSRGQGFKSQLVDLQSLDIKAKEVFAQYQQEDIAKQTARITELQQSLEQIKSDFVAEQSTHAAALQAAHTATQQLQEQFALGGLSEEEASKLSELLEQRRQTQADFDAQENIYRQQTDTTKEKIAEVEAIIKEKELLLNAVADYAAHRAGLTFEQLSAGDVHVQLMEVFKTTGEVKDCFRFTYQGRDYKRLSRSEKVLAGVSMAELVKQLTGRNYPMCIDDSESVVGIPRPTGQAILCRVVAGAPLSVKVMDEPRQAQVHRAA